MSQNSLILPTTGTVSGLQMTQAVNNSLDTLNTLASGASAPSAPEAGQLWHDTTNNLLKIRSLDNTTWIALFTLNESAYTGTLPSGSVLASPALTGTPTAPTATTGNNTTQIATTAFVQAAAQGAGGGINKFRNGTMDIWQRGTISLTVTTAGAYTADGWIVVPTGASCMTIQSTANARTGKLSTYSLLITGATSITDILVKQRIESYIAAPLEGQQVTVQAQIYNNTGSAITPTLTVKHAASQDSWTSPVTDVSAVSLQACANAAWTNVAYTFAASTSSSNGLEITLDFGNNFSSNGKTVQVTELDIRVTAGASTGLNSTPPIPEMRTIQTELALCQRYLPAFNGTAGTNQSIASGFNNATGNNGNAQIFFQTPTRVPVSAVTVSSPSHFQFGGQQISYTTAVSALTFYAASAASAILNVQVTASSTGVAFLTNSSTSAQLLFTGAEL